MRCRDLRIDADMLARVVEEMAGETPFSGVARVSLHGEVVLDRAWGYRNRADRLRCESDTRFGMASGSKTFTAVAVCRLADEGRLSLDDSLHDCLSEDLAGIDEGVTIRHLLTHTSGVADYFDEEEMGDVEFESLWSDRPAYRMRRPRDIYEMFEGKGMKLRPGERFSYSNGGFVLLGMVIEETSGTAFSRFVEESVLRRAGMEDSGYFAMDDLPPRSALGYVEGEDGWKTNIYSVPAVGQPDGGAFTTAPDMERFWDALLSGVLLSPDAVRELTTPQAGASGGESYGLGLWIRDLGNGSLLRYASGSDPGVGFNSGYLGNGAVKITVIRNTDGPCWKVFMGLVSLLKEFLNE